MPVEDDLLAAIKDSFNSAPAQATLAAVLPGGFWDTASNRSPAYPHVLIEDISEVEPGESLEDRRINVTFCVKANDEIGAKQASEKLIAWFDPNQNRAQLTWATGNEVFNWREPTDIERPNQRVKDGARLWTYMIPYVFHVFDQVP